MRSASLRCAGFAARLFSRPIPPNKNTSAMYPHDEGFSLAVRFYPLREPFLNETSDRAVRASGLLSQAEVSICGGHGTLPQVAKLLVRARASHPNSLSTPGLGSATSPHSATLRSSCIPPPPFSSHSSVKQKTPTLSRVGIYCFIAEGMGLEPTWA